MKNLKISKKILKNIKSKKLKSKVFKLCNDRKYLRKINNKTKRSINGNIRKVIKIVAWNKGNCELISKIDEIKVIVQQKKPDIFIVNELNLCKNDDTNMCNIHGYKFEHDNLLKTNGVSRTGMWVANNFNYERVKKSELKGESTIIIRIEHPCKKINVVGFYRQWSQTFNNKPFQSISNKQQETNLENQLNKIKEISNVETIIMGDFNIDAKLFNKNDDEKDNYEKTFKTRIESIKNNLLAENFKQLIKSETRTHKTLDHIYSNTMNKVHSVRIENSTSDHKFIVLEKKMKVIECEERFAFTRKFNSIDNNQLNSDILNSNEYIDMLNEKNVNLLTSNLINVILRSYNNHAPRFKIKIENDTKVKLSNKTSELMKNKNIAYKIMKSNNSQENVKEYNMLSKLVNKAIVSDKNNITRKIFETNFNKPKQLWNTAKEKLYGRNKYMTETIMENDTMKIGSKQVASVLNRFFITKPINIVKISPKMLLIPCLTTESMFLTLTMNLKLIQ